MKINTTQLIVGIALIGLGAYRMYTNKEIPLDNKEAYGNGINAGFGAGAVTAGAIILIEGFFMKNKLFS